MDSVSNGSVHCNHTNGVKSCPQWAVNVSDVVFDYNNESKVLNGLSLTIPQGKVFAILGSSGAGKTTLVRAMIGTLRPQSGTIRVFGHRPGSRESDIPGKGVGYMPQELALFDDFSIKEILTYYGMIYEMSKREMKQRIEELLSFLNLPEQSRTVRFLSGGQQRRVSIAITLVHKPKLVILDEPTVGVDSLLRFQIWNYLERMCKENGQTVVIITHYVEEARKAANVAFLSGGVILKQDNPESLIRQYQSRTLEEVFYILTQQNRTETKTQSVEEQVVEPIEIDHDNHNSDMSIARVKAILWKYNTVMKRNFVFIFVFLFVPAAFLFSARFAFANVPKNIPIGVFNYDRDDYSTAFIQSVDRHYLDLNSYDTKEEALESVVNGTNYMSIGFAANFSDAFERRLRYMDEFTEDDKDISDVKLFVDFTSAPLVVFALGSILKAFKSFLITMQDYLGQNAYKYFHVVYVQEVVHGQLSFNFIDQLDPAVILSEMQIAPLIISALHIIMCRKNAILDRDLVAGVRPNEILIAHFLQTSALIVMQTLFSMLIAFVLNGSKQMGSYLDVFALLFIFGVQGMTLGFTCALLVGTLNGLVVVIFCSVVALWFTSGIFWPIEAVPDYFRYVTDLNTFTLPLNSLRSIMLRGHTIANPTVLLGFGQMILYIIGLNVFNIFAFNKLDK